MRGENRFIQHQEPQNLFVPHQEPKYTRTECGQ
jgi:hypothetical protein